MLAGFRQAGAQPYYFRHYQVENGLSNNTVNCSIQDKAGFLWFGTKDGLNRFDGYRFKQFNTSLDDRTLTPDFVHSLFSDAQGVLWVGLQKGLYRFDAARERLVPFIDSLPDVWAIHITKSGELWFIAQAVLYRYTFGTKQLKRFPPERYFFANALCETPDGAMWAASTDGNLKKWDAAKETFVSFSLFSHSPATTSTYIQKMYPVGTDQILVGTSSQGLKLFQTSMSRYKDILTYNEDRTGIFVRDIVQYAPNEYWLATESGIMIWDFKKNAFTNIRKKVLNPYSLSDNAIYTLCKDREGGIWAGTYFGGVNYYPKQHGLFKKFFPDNSRNSISGNVVREICSDKDGNLWFGTEDAGLNKLNSATGAVTRFQPTGQPGSISYSNIHGLLATGNDLWIGTFEHGLDIMDIRTGKVKKRYKVGSGAYDLKNNFIVTLLQTASGHIFVGSANGLYLYRNAQDGFTRVKGIPEHLFVSTLFEDHNNIVWIGTHNGGLFSLEPATGRVLQFANKPQDRNSLSNNKVNAIGEDSYHNLWIATEGGGLCKLAADRCTFSRYTIKDGLPSNFIFKMLEDNRRQLWVSTSKGLVQLNPANQTVKVYTKANGLLNDQFNYNSGFKDSAGTLYFGSVKGLITFRPDAFVETDFSAPVYITGFQVHGAELAIDQDSGVLKKSVVLTKNITLLHHQSSFSIDFAALSYTAPGMTRYSYKMEGLDKEWTSVATNRKVYFTNLAPGYYTFRVKASGNGLTGNVETSIKIRILPPFWATTWAYLIYAVISIALAYYLIRSYHQYTQGRKEKEIYEAKLDFFTNVAHEIRTPLTLIKGPVENLLDQADSIPEIREDVSALERASNRLMALVTQILDFRKTETKGFSLHFSKVNLTALIQDEYASFAAAAKKRGLTCTTELPATPVSTVADEEALRKILSNLISNAVKYAARHFHIKLHPIQKETTYIIVEVCNDGAVVPADMRETIFEPFYRLKEAARHTGTGIGLALARSLAELHQGRLYMKETPERWNCFVLILPRQPEPRHLQKKPETSLPVTKYE
jgi:signal transduction histidine kinase/ligand-binding sensor domain-containing protein